MYKYFNTFYIKFLTKEKIIIFIISRIESNLKLKQRNEKKN